jgi:hypothetical protein
VVLQWLRAQVPPCPYDPYMCCTAAVIAGHLNVLQWLHSQDAFERSNMWWCKLPAAHGHLEILQWMRAQDPPCPWDVLTCEGAAKGGHLQILQWLRAQTPPCPWDARTCVAAAKGGHPEVLQWVRAQTPPCPWGARTCANAAFGGHVGMLQLLRAQTPPCPWDAGTCALAAMGGHIEVLQWLRAQNPPCPWDASACVFLLQIVVVLTCCNGCEPRTLLVLGMTVLVLGLQNKVIWRFFSGCELMDARGIRQDACRLRALHLCGSGSEPSPSRRSTHLCSVCCVLCAVCCVLCVVCCVLCVVLCVCRLNTRLGASPHCNTHSRNEQMKAQHTMYHWCVCVFLLSLCINL